MDQSARIFNLEEANQALAQVASLVEQLQKLMRSISDTADKLDEGARNLSHGNGHPPDQIKQQMDQLTERQRHLIESFESAVKQLESIGCVLKDLSQGLVDFHGLHDGQIVCLCWRQGEERITFWHDLDTGFAGRQPL